MYENQTAAAQRNLGSVGLSGANLANRDAEVPRLIASQVQSIEQGLANLQYEIGELGERLSPIMEQNLLMEKEQARHGSSPAPPTVAMSPLAVKLSDIEQRVIVLNRAVALMREAAQV